MDPPSHRAASPATAVESDRALARVTHWSALAGAVSWSFFALGPFDLIETLAMLGPLVVVPLALGVAAQAGEAPAGRAARLGALVRRAQPLAACATLPLFLLPSGTLAGSLAGVWFAFTALVALYGLARFRDHLASRSIALLPELCIDAALVYLAVGGAWLLAARLGLHPMGFDPTIVLLTGVHFHFAGFAAPVLAGAAGRALPGPPFSRAYTIGALGAAAGPALIAAGFVLSRAMELASAVLLALCLLLLAAVNALATRRAVRSAAARGLLNVSSLSLLATMAYACMYAWGRYSGRAVVQIPEMARVHGVANALGFATCGLLAWTLEARAQASRSPGVTAAER